MDAEGKPALFGRREDPIVGRIAERLAGPLEGRDEHARDSIARRHAAQLALGRLGVAEGELGHRDQAPSRVGAEVHDPAVVGAEIGLGEILVLALGDIQKRPSVG